jgi:hypothetical protein
MESSSNFEIINHPSTGSSKGASDQYATFEAENLRTPVS